MIGIEFARKSEDKRITLVIDDAASPVRTLWTVMDTSDLDAARESLWQREGKPKAAHIGHWKTGEVRPASIPSLPEWATAHGVEAVIWTALPAQLGREVVRRPTIDEVLDHLRKLEGAERDLAEQYVRLAPRQIDTAYRRRIEAELGWTPLDKWPA